MFSLADMAVFPWFELIRTVGYQHPSGVKTRTFLNTKRYVHVNRWADSLVARKAVQRGMLVCRKRDYPKPWLNATETRFKHLLTEEETRSLEKSRL